MSQPPGIHPVYYDPVSQTYKPYVPVQVGTTQMSYVPPGYSPHQGGSYYNNRGGGVMPYRGAYRPPVQNIGYMRPPKRDGTHFSVSHSQPPPSQRSLVPPFLVPPESETFDVNWEPDAIPSVVYPIPAVVPPSPLQEAVVVMTPVPSPMPVRPADAPPSVYNMMGMPGMALSSIARPTPVQSAGASVNVEDTDVKLKRIRRRDFQFTYFGDITPVVRRMCIDFKHLISYCVFQHEICPSTGRPHWQGYIEFFNPVDIGFVKNDLFKDTSVHVEIRLRSREDSRNYCKKERTRMPGPQTEVGPFEVGTWREVGASTKMHSVRQALADGQDIADMAVDEPGIVLRSRANLVWYQDQVQMKEAMTKPRTVTVRLFVGPTGTGKTHMAVQEALFYTKGDYSQIFILDSGGRDKDPWFDGYTYGPVMIIDDFDSWIQVAFLLRLLDKYPCRLPVKGSTKWAKYTEVWITSNKPMQQWTNLSGEPIDPKHQEALYRRIDYILWIPERGKYSFLKTPVGITLPPKRHDLPTVTQSTPVVTPAQSIAPPPPVMDENKEQTPATIDLPPPTE